MKNCHVRGSARKLKLKDRRSFNVKVIFCLLISNILYSSTPPTITAPTLSTTITKADDFDEFDAIADEMVEQGMAEKIDIKEPSFFQLMLRRMGGPIVMVYVRMREKMDVLWAWIIQNKKKIAKKS